MPPRACTTCRSWSTARVSPQRLARGPVGVAEASAIAQRLCRALASAHALSIVHRDVKPANVLITAEGAVKLADFGVAKLAEGSTAGSIGAGVVGTPKYMAPEQGRGDAVGPATDVYSAGVVLYEMLAGRPPFDAVSAVELAVSPICSRRRRRWASDVPASAREPSWMRALAKDPADRFPDGAAMADALAAAARGRPPASISAPPRPPGSPDPTVAQPRRGPRTDYDPAARRRNITVLVGVIALIAALATAAIVGSGPHRSRGGRPAEDRGATGDRGGSGGGPGQAAFAAPA